MEFIKIKLELDPNMKIIIDAKQVALGRLASYAAKQAVLGKEIVIVNAEKAIITGKVNKVVERYYKKRKRGGSSQKGPYFPSMPDFILKRTIRGMLSHREGRGRSIFKRIRCYAGVPSEFEDAEKVSVGRVGEGNYITLEILSRRLKK